MKTEEVQITLVSENGEPRVSSRLIADRLDIEHESVMRHLTGYQKDFEMFGGVRFQIGTFETAGGPQQTRWAMLNENQAYLLLTYARNTPRARALKINLISAFQTARVPLVPQVLTRSDLARMILEAESELETERAKNATLEPKAEAFEELISSTGLMSVAQAAKILGTGEVRLFAILRARGVLMSREVSGNQNHNLPYQAHIEAGRFEVKVSPFKVPTGEVRSNNVTYVTGKGLDFIRRLLHQAKPLVLEAASA
jgi:anti-repressor protein